MEDIEIWKEISNYDNYKISSFGNVKNNNTGNIMAKMKLFSASVLTLSLMTGCSVRSDIPHPYLEILAFYKLLILKNFVVFIIFM